MSRRLHKSEPVSPQMNMTPLIDVTFQLIIFFMVVSNLIGQEAVPMRVPMLENPQTRQLGESDRVVVNVLPADDGKMPWVQIGLTRLRGSDRQGISKALEQMVAHNADVQVVLRADGSLDYQQVRPVMQAIRDAGVSVVHLVAQDQPLPPRGGEQ
jgi:biopolymer transport protein ExbD